MDIAARLSPSIRRRVPTVEVEHVPSYRKVDYIVSGYRGHPPLSPKSESKNQKDLHSSHDYVEHYNSLSETQIKQIDPNSEEHYHYPLSWCVQSLFCLHNETINIWTHLIGTAFFLYLGYHGLDDLFIASPVDTPKVSILHKEYLLDQVVFMIYIGCSACCFLGSSLFHWFSAVNKKYHFRLRVLDFMGIAFLTVGSQWPLLYYAFYCERTAILLYSTLLSILTLFGFTFPAFPIFHDPKYRTIRVSVYIAMSALPVVMFTHILGQYGLYHESTYLFGYLGITYLTYVFGLFFYITRWPERWWPGKFDIWFSSHQLWHCIAILGAYVWYLGFTKFMHWRWHNPCVAVV